MVQCVCSISIFVKYGTMRDNINLLVKYIMFKFCVKEEQRDNTLLYNDVKDNYFPDKNDKEIDKIKPSEELNNIIRLMIFGNSK